MRRNQIIAFFDILLLIVRVYQTSTETMNIVSLILGAILVYIVAAAIIGSVMDIEEQVEEIEEENEEIEELEVK
jgi:hypothetical protein